MENRDTTYLKIKDWALDQGFSLFGVADIRPFRKDFLNLSSQLVNSFDSGISMAVRLSDAILEEIEENHPDLIESFYTNFKFAMRAKNHAYKDDPEKGRALQHCNTRYF